MNTFELIKKLEAAEQRGIEKGRRTAAREVLDMYIDYYGEKAEEGFMQKVAHKFSSYD